MDPIAAGGLRRQDGSIGYRQPSPDISAAPLTPIRHLSNTTVATSPKNVLFYWVLKKQRVTAALGKLRVCQPGYLHHRWGLGQRVFITAIVLGVCQRYTLIRSTLWEDSFDRKEGSESDGCHVGQDGSRIALRSRDGSLAA